MKKLLIYGAAAMVLAACSHNRGWQVSGTLTGAPQGTKLAIEGFNGASWYPIDSVSVGSNGAFSYKAPQPGTYADIYRIGYNGHNIYFPADSVDAVTITADAENFDNGYKLSGTQAAEDMMHVDQRIAESVSANGIDGALTDSLLKVDLNHLILSDNAGVVSYYIINKTIGGKPLYNPANRKDVAMLGATANKFSVSFPDDPRTRVLTSRYIDARQQHGLGTSEIGTIEANAVGHFEIQLYDPKGQLRSLSDTADKAKATILCFTAYDIEQSLPFNVELNSLYEKYKSKGLEIYQVAIDSDEVEWRQRAQNIPWIAVRANPETDATTLLRNYNVGAIPMSFIIDDNGDILERVVDPTQLEDAVRKVL